MPKAQKPSIVEPDFDEPAPAEQPTLTVVEDEIVDAEIVEETPAPTPSGDNITAAQLKALHAALTGMGIKDRDRGLLMLSKIAGRDVASTKDLTKAEASKVIDALNTDGDDDA